MFFSNSSHPCYECVASHSPVDLINQTSWNRFKQFGVGDHGTIFSGYLDSMCRRKAKQLQLAGRRSGLSWVVELLKSNMHSIDFKWVLKTRSVVPWFILVHWISNNFPYGYSITREEHQATMVLKTARLSRYRTDQCFPCSNMNPKGRALKNY